MMQSSAFIAPPLEFAGTLDDLLDLFIIPNLPPVARLAELTRTLLDYALHDPGPTLIVRGPQKGHCRRVNGSLIVDTDNAPAIWTYLLCRDASADLNAVPEHIRSGNVPVLMAINAREAPHWNFGRAMSNAERIIWDHHLKHCHLFAVREPRLSPLQQFLRSLCPLNHFLFPSPAHYQMERLGWSEPGNVSDLGESATTIALVQKRILQLLDKQGSAVYDSFLTAVGGDLLGQVSSNLRVRLVQKVRYQTPLTVDPSAQSEKRRRWTLNERHGYFSATRLRPNVIRLSLSFQKANGEKITVGEFRLDLAALSQLKVVSAQNSSAGILYGVRIIRDCDESFSLRLGRKSLPLELLAYPARRAAEA
jgi:hypothetical protein